MKTPKRDYKKPPFTQFDLDPDWFEDYYQQQEQRWKRKNRVKQLKATITRLRAENLHLRLELAEAMSYGKEQEQWN